MLPNFVVIGAARSGTTYLYHNLISHPQIFMSLKKETQFFTSNWDKGFEWYATWFEGITKETMVGEASMTYTYPEYATVAPARLAEHLPDARLIYLVRNPVVRTFSHYNYYRHYSGVETDDFPTALKKNSIYLGTSMYVEWLEKYLQYFSKDKILVVVFEELTANPQAEMAKIFNFLGVDPSFVSPHLTTKTNQTFKPKNEGLFQMYRYLSASSVRTWLESFIPNSLRPHLRNLVRKVFGTKENTPKLDPETELYLINHFEPEIKRLEIYLGRNLDVLRTQ